MSSLLNFKIENSDMDLFFLNEFKYFSERKIELISRYNDSKIAKWTQE
jgi:hypothetical protein